MPRIGCPKCRAKFGTRVRRNKRRCKECRYEWNPKKLPLHLTKDQWKQILKWFMLEQSSNRISVHTRIERKRILRALEYARKALVKDIPEQFSGIVEVDETYMGGQWKNKRKSVRAKGTKRGRGTSKQPVFGILCRSGLVWAEIVDNVEAQTLQPLIKKQVTKGSVINSDTWKGYTGIATQGYVHRLVKHSEGEYSDTKGTHINGLEGFWGYLKRKLAAKGGIRRDKLWLYLGEYVWRYNHRKLSVDEQILKVINLLNKRRLIGG